MPRVEKTVYIELCNKDATIPEYTNTEDAACDAAIYENVKINPGETKLIGLGFKIAIPKGYELQIRPRSGLSYKTQLRIPNSPGTIDTNYRDELKVILQNTGKDILKFKKGDRIAQLVLNEVPKAIFTQIDDIKKIKGDRGGGIGSSKLNISEK
jgi:dUTP pyrophosphatase